MEAKNNLVEYNKNLTPEQKEERRQKSLQTRRERSIIASSIKKQMKNDYVMKRLDDNGNEITQVVKGSDLIATRLITDIMSEKTTPMEAVKIATFIRDTIGEKPKEEVEKKVDATVKMSWEALVNKIHEDD